MTRLLVKVRCKGVLNVLGGVYHSDICYFRAMTSSPLYLLVYWPVFRSHRLHAVHEMQPIATDVARSVVCNSVCMCVCLPVCWSHGCACKHG